MFRKNAHILILANFNEVPKRTVKVFSLKRKKEATQS